MNMIKEDYANILKLLERVKLEGLTEARYVATLAHKLEIRVDAWFDGHVTGFKQDEAEVKAEVEKIEIVPEAIYRAFKADINEVAEAFTKSAPTKV